MTITIIRHCTNPGHVIPRNALQWDYFANAKSRASIYTNPAKSAGFCGYRNSPKRVDVRQCVRILRPDPLTPNGDFVQKVAKVFRFVVLALALLGLGICMFKSYKANHYFDVVLMGAISVILLNTDRLTWALDTSPRTGTSLTLHFPENVQERLAELGRLIGSTNVLDIVRRALIVYDATARAVRDDGARIFVEYPDGKREELEILSPKSTDDKPVNSAPVNVQNATFQNVTGDDIRKIVKEQFEEMYEKPDLLNELASSDFGMTEDRAREVIKAQSVNVADKPRESIPPQIR